ncbi:MAG: methyltransferase domain-containing protein [candidate division Zixibacteria bacterium]|nr:methyltransferase domain-containing protein [candidate division Zixibacteria bacterium]
MDITSPKMEEYIKQMLNNHKRQFDEILTEMEDYAMENKFPIIGPMVGPFLQQLTISTRAKRVFEMGSGYGYSAMWFAGGIRDGGKIICTDGSPDNGKRAMEYFKRAGVDDKVEFHIGDANEIIQKFHEPFDIIYNDIDKEGYPLSFELAIPKLRKGGMFITDNVLWSGRIFDDEPTESTKGIIEFNRMLFSSEDVISTIIPIRDGLGIAVKL